MHDWIYEKIELGIRHLQAGLKRETGSRVEMGTIERVILYADDPFEHVR